MNDSINILKNNLEKSIKDKKNLLDSELELQNFKNASNKIKESYLNGGRLYIAGNGGSAADAQHLAAEFVCKLSKDRIPIPAEALTVDTSLLTSIANDYGFDKIFSRQIEAKLNKNDIFLGLTTSGNSKNILSAIEKCKLKNIPSIIFTGKEGGIAKKNADFCVSVPDNSTARIQEAHILLCHSICEYIESVIL